MKRLKYNILWITIVLLAAISLLYELIGSSNISILRICMPMLCLLSILLNQFFIKKKVKKMKQDLNLEGDYSLEELEKIRIENDYQKNFVNKLNLK